MRQDLFPHLAVFVICSGILAGALILSPASDEVPSIQLWGTPLPGLCVFRCVTGIPCPGCGLARSVVAAIHGGVGNSLEYHRLGLVILLYVFLQFIYRGAVLVFPNFRKSSLRFASILDKGLIILAVLLGLNWIITLILLI
jgi:hypothetical protein